MTDKKSGTLYGVGVGPGDPQLLTLMAIEVLGRAAVIFAASSTKNGHSLALSVVRGHLAPAAEIRLLKFPMTESPDDLNQAWTANAQEVIDVLESGRDAAFLTIGDPLTYSTYGYLLRTILRQEPQTKVMTVPGITAYHAAAARLNLPLTMGTESLMVIPGILTEERIKDLAEAAENMVIMKAYRNFPQICQALKKLGLEDKAVLVSHCGHADEKLDFEAVCRPDKTPPYLSLLIVKKNGLS